MPRFHESVVCGIIMYQFFTMDGRIKSIFNGFKQDMLEFMLDIRFHNSKEFMDAHREQYIEKVRTPYFDLINSMADVMLSIDPQMEVRPSKCLSRIFRDTRFSKDKSPYRDHHWIAFRRAGIPREAAPMFWFEVRIERVSWGLGYWGENKGALEILRRRMIAHPGEFHQLNRLLEENRFVLAGDDYKRLKPPDDLDPMLIPWYTKKELLFMKDGVNADIIFKKTLPQTLTKDFRALAPLYRLMQGCYDLAANGGEIE